MPYTLDSLKWNIKLKGQKELAGFFATFDVQNQNGETFYYPLGFHFAFCPNMYVQEFNSIKPPFTEKPSYIIQFNAPDIEKLELIIPPTI
ncbi:MAG TPA: hypothetical protein VI757_14420 [Bacteroidia bacterium]|nr:hypothetical protein [Bacteroidia bacterium]